MVQQPPDLIHCLWIAPNLSAEWLFDVARAYWERFRPTVVSNSDFLVLLPTDRRLVVTTLARRDLMTQLGVTLGRVRLDAVFDPIAADDRAAAEALLARRIAEGWAFGDAFRQVRATDAAPPFVPTPRIGTFITQTPPPSPTPDVTPSPTPSATPSPTPSEEPAAPPTESTQGGIRPIQPTPGSLLGG